MLTVSDATELYLHTATQNPFLFTFFTFIIDPTPIFYVP